MLDQQPSRGPARQHVQVAVQGDDQRGRKLGAAIGVPPDDLQADFGERAPLGRAAGLGFGEQRRDLHRAVTHGQAQVKTAADPHGRPLSRDEQVELPGTPGRPRPQPGRPDQVQRRHLGQPGRRPRLRPAGFGSLAPALVEQQPVAGHQVDAAR